MADMDFETEGRGYEEESRGFDRERSRSPRGDRRGDDESRNRSASPNGRDRGGDRRPPPEPRAPVEDEEAARNPGSNLFVTGIHPDLSEEQVSRLFEKYGEVEKCNIMRDPHTRESRGFGFVKMVTPEQADAAKEGLQGEVHQGRTLSIEKARRSRPRTPTPGKYFGPPKRDDFRGGRGGGRFDRYDDRRGGGYGRRDDRGYGGGGGGRRYEDRYEDRRGGGSYGRDRGGDDYSGGGYRGNVDRYASRDDRSYGGRGGDDRRGGGGYYDREERGAGGSASASYGAGAEAPESRGAGRSYEDRGEDRYSRR